MNKAFLISTTAALALGYAGGFASNGLLAQAAVAFVEPHSVSVMLGEPVEDTIEALVQQRACPQLDAEMGSLGAPACSAKRDLQGQCLDFCWKAESSRPDGDAVEMRVNFGVQANKVYGAPQ